MPSNGDYENIEMMWNLTAQCKKSKYLGGLNDECEYRTQCEFDYELDCLHYMQEIKVDKHTTIYEELKAECGIHALCGTDVTVKSSDYNLYIECKGIANTVASLLSFAALLYNLIL